MKLLLTTNFLTRWLFDVRLWIIVLFIIRLENINLPPLDEHEWRQTSTLGVARDYVEVNPKFFEPRTIICDSREGILAQEFPLFNYSIAILWKIFGHQNWCFRLFNLLIASIGLLYFSKIALRFVGEKGSLFATVIFGASVAFMYARKGMPDVFAVSLVIIGVEYGWRYLEEKKSLQLLLYILFSALGMLCKMPAACVMGIMAAPLFAIKADRKQKLNLLGGSIIAVCAMGAWYFVWAPWAEREYGFPLFFATSITEGLSQLIAMKNDTISRFYPIALTSRIAFVFCMIGLLWMFWKKNRPLAFAFAASTALLFGLMLKAGGTFSGHVYYIIPYVPMMALLAGYGLSEAIKNKWLQITLLLLITIEAVVQHKSDFFIPYEDLKFLKLEKIADQYVPKDSRILVNNREGSPVMMYFAHRRGWTVTDRMKDSSWVAGESTVGLQYIIIERSRWHDTLSFPMLYQDNDFQVYKTMK
ncbi:MAG: glycosyltransferase family 39 protein [Saprospiraceae bacterium]|uniref:Glycosyltransferase family 39 protein n=1 Tax=Candidatus Opimibacter skivensis TaxID=2982028 RepID=A0A9D7ST06_9BACT|nr:glycosyltransferase family 39 protein [Candidatus Opimibacter skivensis]